MEFKEARHPKRVIAKLELKSGSVVKGIMLEGVQRVGEPDEMIQRYYEDGADELFILDFVASLYGRRELHGALAGFCRNVFVPICVGGGIRSCQDAEALFRAGADRICVNTHAVLRPPLLRELVLNFGAQSVVVQLDLRRAACGDWLVMYNSGRDIAPFSLVDWISRVTDFGVGELAVTAVHRDGVNRGPDISLIQYIDQISRLSVIYCGGVATVRDVALVLGQRRVQAVALASSLHSRALSVREIKSHLDSLGFAVRR